MRTGIALVMVIVFLSFRDLMVGKIFNWALITLLTKLE